MIGKHKCKRAQNTDLKGAITIGLDDAFTALCHRAGKTGQ